MSGVYACGLWVDGARTSAYDEDVEVFLGAIGCAIGSAGGARHCGEFGAVLSARASREAGQPDGTAGWLGGVEL
jgi:hypothetical protein